MLKKILTHNSTRTYKRKQFAAVTLVELILAVSIMALLVGVILPVTQNLLFQDEQSSTVNLAVKSLRTTQQFAMNGNGDSSWGVEFLSGSITEFKGTDYAHRDLTADAITTVSSRISFSGTTEIVFSRMYGAPAAATTVNVRENGVTKTITVSAKGMVSY